MKVGLLGLGKMGVRIAEKLLKEGHQVNVWNRSKEVMEEFQAVMTEQHLATNLALSYSISSLVESLQTPRVIWMMLPAGEPTESVFTEVSQFLSPGDIVIDGGNAFYKDTQRRYDWLQAKKMHYLGIGVSGGILAEKNGYPLMVGGDKDAYASIAPLLDSLAKPHGGHAYFGQGGAGHFVKMVHNGVEYGMMQAIGEGFGVLDSAPYPLDLLSVAELWQKGTIVSSFLVDRTKDALEKDTKLSDILGRIDATGEAEWTIKQAKEEDVPVPVIKESLLFRQKSMNDPLVQNSFAAKVVAALRREFGGHKVEKK